MNREVLIDNSVSESHDLDHPILIIIRGIPGSGKSYLATTLKESIGQQRVVTLDPDAIDQASEEYIDFSKALAAEGVDTKLHPYRFSRSKAHEAITAHKVIIWNQGFTNLDGFEKTVKNLQTFALEHNTQLPLLLVEVEVSEHTAKARVTKREEQGGHGVPDEAFARFINDYKSFANQGYNTVIVHGKDDITQSVATVEKALKKLE